MELTGSFGKIKNKKQKKNYNLFFFLNVGGCEYYFQILLMGYLTKQPTIDYESCWVEYWASFKNKPNI